MNDQNKWTKWVHIKQITNKQKNNTYLLTSSEMSPASHKLIIFFLIFLKINAISPLTFSPSDTKGGPIHEDWCGMEPVTPKPDIAPTRPNDMLPSDVHTITPLPYYISSGDQVWSIFLSFWLSVRQSICFLSIVLSSLRAFLVRLTERFNSESQICSENFIKICL